MRERARAGETSASLPGSQRVGAAYDAIADAYDEHLRGARWSRRALWWQFDGLFRPGDRVLDVGCGTGLDTVHLASRGIHVTAVDASRGMLAKLRAKVDAASLGARVDAREGDVVDVLRQLDGPFDGLVSSFAALNTVDVTSFAREAARLVRPGAYLVAHLLAPGHGLARARRLGAILWPRAANDRAEVDIRGHRLLHRLAVPDDVYRSGFESAFARRERSWLGPVIAAASFGRFYVLELQRRPRSAPSAAGSALPFSP